MSIVELLEHFRDDAQLQPLFAQLDTLRERVQGRFAVSKELAQNARKAMLISGRLSIIWK